MVEFSTDFMLCDRYYSVEYALGSASSAHAALMIMNLAHECCYRDYIAIYTP